MINKKCQSISFVAVLTIMLLHSTALTAANNSDELSTRLTQGDRSDTDKQRDAGRKPAQVLAFLGVKPGMTTMDVLAAGGYYTEVLSNAVGAEGKVYAQNSAMMLRFRDGANAKAISARLKDNRLSNVIRWDRELQGLDLEPNSIDVAITALNFHDVYNNSPEAALGMLNSIKLTLKPGGVLGIIDHSGLANADNAGLHRMTSKDAIDMAKKAGFNVETSELLANDQDDLTQMVFAPGIRGKTDRFVLKLVKPGAT